MYQKKQVIRQSPTMTDKTYHRQLFGRVFTLHRMIQKRVEKVNQHKEKVYGYEKQIRSLERKIERVKKDISSIRKENRVIQSEVKSYRKVIEKLKDKDDLEYKPKWSIRSVQKGKSKYWYIEGRIRLPMVNGRKGKETTISYGRYEDVVKKYQLIYGETYKTLPPKYIDTDLQKRLKDDLEERWWDGIKLLEG